jgi:hypothetical protein
MKRQNELSGGKSSEPRSKSFLDTSAVQKLQIGHSRHKEYLTEAIPKTWYVNNYVRMEFFRTLLMNWVSLYFESEQPSHKTFGDALKYFSDEFGRVPKSILNGVASMLEVEGFSMSDPADKEYCRQKLQDVIFAIAFQFDTAFVNTGIDPTSCTRVRHALRLPLAEERDAVLRQLSLTFYDVAECRSRCKVENMFGVKKYADRMQAVSVIHAVGTAKQAIGKISAAITKAQGAPENITCRSCGSIGDAVIAVSLDQLWKLHSMDNAHRLIAESLQLECEIHPSLKRLLKPDSEQPESEG